jgi:hydrogenase nickel incorporation protein HypA/HybF
MHEMPLAEGILDIVLQVAEGHPVRQVRVRAGALQRVVPDSLQFCFELAAAGTPAADAVLAVQVTPARLRCRRCHAQTEQLSPPFLCGRCGDPDVAYLCGKELLVDGVELDTGWRRRPGAPDAEHVHADVEPGHLEEHARAERAGLHAPDHPA